MRNKAICGVCGQRRALTLSGDFRRHWIGHRRGDICGGSGLPPAQARAAIASVSIPPVDVVGMCRHGMTDIICFGGRYHAERVS